MEMPNRNFTSENYRYGYNGAEKDDEVKGNGNSYDFGARIYDNRLGRWLSLDPLQSKYPDLSPYNFVANSPLVFIDPDGRKLQFFGTKKALEEFKVLVSKVTEGEVKADINEKRFVTFSATTSEISDQNQRFLDEVNEVVGHDETTNISIVGSEDNREKQFVGGFKNVHATFGYGEDNLIRKKKIGAIDVKDIDFIDEELDGELSGQSLLTHEIVENYTEQVTNIEDGDFDSAHESASEAQGRVDGVTDVKNTLKKSKDTKTKDGKKSYSGRVDFKRKKGKKKLKTKVNITNGNPSGVK